MLSVQDRLKQAAHESAVAPYDYHRVKALRDALGFCPEPVFAALGQPQQYHRWKAARDMISLYAAAPSQGRMVLAKPVLDVLATIDRLPKASEIAQPARPDASWKKPPHYTEI